jgi:hypothetical protein
MKRGPLVLASRGVGVLAWLAAWQGWLLATQSQENRVNRSAWLENERGFQARLEVQLTSLSADVDALGKSAGQLERKEVNVFEAVSPSQRSGAAPSSNGTSPGPLPVRPRTPRAPPPLDPVLEDWDRQEQTVRLKGTYEAFFTQNHLTPEQRSLVLPLLVELETAQSDIESLSRTRQMEAEDQYAAFQAVTRDTWTRIEELLGEEGAKDLRLFRQRIPVMVEFETYAAQSGLLDQPVDGAALAQLRQIWFQVGAIRDSSALRGDPERSVDPQQRLNRLITGARSFLTPSQLSLLEAYGQVRLPSPAQLGSAPLSK